MTYRLLVLFCWVLHYGYGTKLGQIWGRSSFVAKRGIANFDPLATLSQCAVSDKIRALR